MISDENYKIIAKQVSNVKELKAILDKIPDDYEVSCLGVTNFAVASSTTTNSVLLDELSFMEENDFEEEQN